MIDQRYFEWPGFEFGAHDRQCIRRRIDANGFGAEPTQLSCENPAIGVIVIDHQDSLAAQSGADRRPRRARLDS